MSIYSTVLDHMHENEGRIFSAADLSGALGLKKGGVLTTLAKLAKDGEITRYAGGLGTAGLAPVEPEPEMGEDDEPDFADLYSDEMGEDDESDYDLDEMGEDDEPDFEDTQNMRRAVWLDSLQLLDAAVEDVYVALAFFDKFKGRV